MNFSGVNDKVEFPPDKDDTALESPEPDRPMTSPVRQRHRLVQHHQGVGGYSTGYTSSSSEDSRSSRSTLPSLHHSYETLNISDTGVIISHPHRPAPKPPGADISLCRLCVLVTRELHPSDSSSSRNVSLVKIKIADDEFSFGAVIITLILLRKVLSPESLIVDLEVLNFI